MKHKYRSALIGIILLFACITCVGFLLFRATRPNQLPSKGIWYCAELNTTIDCSAQPNTITIGTVTWKIVCDYSGCCYILEGDDPGSEVKYGSLVKRLIPFQKNTIIIRLYTDNTKYVFTMDYL